ncbi:hypothetical protein EXIGLDRAFT_760805 [Exidia glandulosa HHB12029]|uniref:Uncharacterized protein n=1 Tax=Exidia glandulosa HHB12029 TaxID=1314781 RepID=A0A165NW56_EXIGL|nr:hypothetical protein EXIGLDRAFT_760805 [Exidia glandulosa HHB12029]
MLSPTGTAVTSPKLTAANHARWFCDNKEAKESVVAAFDKNDAKGLWAALCTVALPTTISSRYVVLMDLIQLTMRTNKTLEGLLGRIQATATEWRNLWPVGFTLEHAFFEFVLGTFLHGLSVKCQLWSSGMLQQLKHGATIDAVESFCRIEDGNQTLHGNPAARAMAVCITPVAPVPVLGLPHSGQKVTREDALAALHAAWGQSNCFICNGKHTSDKCTFIDVARNTAVAARKLQNQSQRTCSHRPRCIHY